MKSISAKSYGLWELAVLSLLRERPMHPYEIQRVLKERHKDDVLVLKMGSLYHAIRRLHAAELVEAKATTREGRHPERTTYRITKTGKLALADWLKRRVAVPQPERSSFMGAISFMIHLTPAEAMEGLALRVAALEQQVAGLDQTITNLLPRIGRINVLETEYARAMQAAELEWTRTIVKEIRAGRLDWDLEAILEGVRAAATEANR